MARCSIGVGTTPLPRAANGRRLFRLEMPSVRGAILQNNNWQLMPSSLPAMQMELTPVGRVVRTSGIEPPGGFPGAGFEIPAHATVSLLVDQSHLTTAYPELTVSGGAKSTIRLTYAEALVDSKGEKGNRNEIAGKHIVGIYDEFLPDGSQKRACSCPSLGERGAICSLTSAPLTSRFVLKTSVPGSRPSRLKSVPVSNRTTRSLGPDLANRLAYGPARCARHLHGYAVLGATCSISATRVSRL